MGAVFGDSMLAQAWALTQQSIAFRRAMGNLRNCIWGATLN